MESTGSPEAEPSKSTPEVVQPSEKENVPPVPEGMERYLAAVVESFRGPLPPPEILRQYDEIVPGSAKQLLDEAWAQGKHRQSLERTTVEGGSDRANKGLYLGFVSFVLLLIAAFILVLTGHDAAGIAFIGIDVTGLVGSFIFGTISQRRERSQKFREVQERLPNGTPQMGHDRARAQAGQAGQFESSDPTDSVK